MYVTAWPGETFEHLVGRYRRALERSGILGEARRRRHFIPNHERRRDKIRRAQRRALRAARARGEV